METETVDQIRTTREVDHNLMDGVQSSLKDVHPIQYHQLGGLAIGAQVAGS